MWHDKADVIQAMWAFAGGAILVLLQSIYMGVKRSWHALLIGCIFGGLGSWVAFATWPNSTYLPIICGVAAVMTENLLLGALKASKEFAAEPIQVFTHFFKLIVPFFGKVAGDSTYTDPSDQKPSDK